MGQSAGQRRKRVAIAAVVMTVAASVLAVVTVMSALRAEEERQKAERQRATRETPNYGYDPGYGTVDAAEVLQQETAERELARLEAEAERAMGMGDHFPNHVHGERKPEWPTQAKAREPATPRRADADDPLAGFDSL